LAWIETLNPRKIDLSLDRVKTVLDRLKLFKPAFGVVTVTGTNGKGSTVAMLEAIWRAAGYRVGAYTSPHLVAYNERIRLNGDPAGDANIVTSFERINAARGEIPLTYFEFGTIAALDLMTQANVDIAVLEVGMGGRLDAVNAVDADCAIVTSVDIDHAEWLGDTREKIGFEKAGIFRAGKPAICGDLDAPASLLAHANDIGAKLMRFGHDYTLEKADGGWAWKGVGEIRAGLPYPAMRGEYQLTNAAGALMALQTLSGRFPVQVANVRQGLLTAVVPGRFQVLPGLPLRIFDVAHNPHAARALVQNLEKLRAPGVTHAVFGMLADKDIEAVARVVQPHVDRWYVFTINDARSASAELLSQKLCAANVPAASIEECPNAVSAYRTALQRAQPNDRVLVFGSFHTVGDILATL
jgi:dihydrofolate synthase/folylpolyglutamate synthase